MSMMFTRFSFSCLGCCALLGWQLLVAAVQDPVPQDPVPPRSKPAGSEAPAATKQGEEAAADEPKPAAKPLPGRAPRHRFEGVYVLRRRVLNGSDDQKPNHGYLVITARHLFLTLAAPGPSDERPLVHAGVRRWQELSDGVRTTMLLDYYSDDTGVIHIEPRGKQEVRQLELVRGGIRVVQGDRTWLEFERIE